MAVYLLTGAAGFIGSAVARQLLGLGHRVIAVDNLDEAYDLRLKQWRLRELEAFAQDSRSNHEGLIYKNLDICDESAVASLFSGLDGFDGVINLAARAGVRRSLEDPGGYVQVNTAGTLNLLEECRKHEVPKFVLASTSSLYGAANPTPFREDADTNKPLSPYAASKKAAEALCHTYHHLYGIDVTVFRYFTVYGPAGRPDMSLFRFIQWVSEGKQVTIFGDGSQSRDFTYVEDIARGTVAGLKPLSYEVINLGSDRPNVLLDALRLIEEAVAKKAKTEFQPMHRADVRATWADISKARELLGWSPQTQLAEGIRRSVEWYQANRDWARKIKTA